MGDRPFLRFFTELYGIREADFFHGSHKGKSVGGGRPDRKRFDAPEAGGYSPFSQAAVWRLTAAITAGSNLGRRS